MLKSQIPNPKSQINPNIKYQIKKNKPYNLFIILFLSFVILTSGCASVKEAVKGIAGISTKSLEEARKDAISKAFNYDYFSCYTKIMDILREINAYIYKQDIKNHMIAIYISEEDTTPVGLFFTETTSSLTQIEVSSPSTYAKEFIAKKIFPALDVRSETSNSQATR